MSEPLSLRTNSASYTTDLEDFPQSISLGPKAIKPVDLSSKCVMSTNFKCGIKHGRTHCKIGYCSKWGWCSFSDYSKKFQQPLYSENTCKNGSLVKPVDLGSACRMAGANRRCGDEFRDKHCNTGFCNRTGWCGSAPRRDDQLAYGGGTCINGIKVKPVLRKVKKSSCKLESNGRCGRGHGNLICRRGYCDYYGYCSQSSVAKKWQQKEFSASASTGACRASLVNLLWGDERQDTPHDYQSCVKIMTQARRIFRTTQWKSAMKKYCKKTYGPQSID